MLDSDLLQSNSLQSKKANNMNIKHVTVSFLILLLVVASNVAVAQTGKVYTIKANELKADIQPTMWGVSLKISTWAPTEESMLS